MAEPVLRRHQEITPPPSTDHEGPVDGGEVPPEVLAEMDMGLDAAMDATVEDGLNEQYQVVRETVLALYAGEVATTVKEFDEQQNQIQQVALLEKQIDTAEYTLHYLVTQAEKSAPSNSFSKFIAGLTGAERRRSEKLAKLAEQKVQLTALKDSVLARNVDSLSTVPEFMQMLQDDYGELTHEQLASSQQDLYGLASDEEWDAMFGSAEGGKKAPEERGSTDGYTELPNELIDSLHPIGDDPNEQLSLIMARLKGLSEYHSATLDANTFAREGSAILAKELKLVVDRFVTSLPENLQTDDQFQAVLRKQVLWPTIQIESQLTHRARAGRIERTTDGRTDNSKYAVIGGRKSKKEPKLKRNGKPELGWYPLNEFGEDACSIDEESHTMAVADGSTSYENSAEASRRVVAAVTEIFKSLQGSNPAELQQDLVEKLAALPESLADMESDAGTTLTAYRYFPEHGIALVVKIGDSPIYRQRKGQIEEIKLGGKTETTDKSMTSSMLYRKSNTEPELFVPKGGSIEQLVAVIDVEEGDALAIMSDGVDANKGDVAAVFGNNPESAVETTESDDVVIIVDQFKKS